MIGVEINYDYGWSNILKKILKNIEIKNYNWSILEREVVKLNVEPGVYSGKDFNMFVDACDEGYVICFNCQAFGSSEKISPINNYEEFINSQCELVILIDDGRIIEIYFKEQMKDLIISALKENNLPYQEKTLENDQRKSFLVFD